MPEHSQESDGSVLISLGSKGDLECDLVASGAAWGRGPTRDVHSSYAARLDQPAWRLVQALNTLVTPTGDPAIDGLFEHVRPVSAAEHAMLDKLAERLSEVGGKGSDRRQGLGARCHVAPGARGLRLAPDGHHRRPRRRLRRARRQDGPAAQDDGQARHAPRARHDARGRLGKAQGAPREARLQRHPDSQEWRLQLRVVDAVRIQS